MSDASTPVLRDVTGPSALGGGWRRMWDLVWIISITEFKRTYFGTSLGYLWSILRPLSVFAVLLVVFTQVFRLGATVPHYPVLLLFNFVLMGFFTESTTTAVTSIVTHEGIVRKTQFPRLVIPVAVVVTGLLNLGLNLIVVFVFLLAFGVTPTVTWLLFPFDLIALFVLTTGASMVVSSLYPRFRDVGIIWSVFSLALFYATPVLYPLERVPAALQKVLLLNPLTSILQLARQWVVDPSAPGLRTIAGSVWLLLAPVAIFIAVCLLGVWLFRREAPRIAEEL
jgi:ABC-2 type transport system permease protein